MGRVVFIGAGPGAADLITVRGLARLRAADVVAGDDVALRLPGELRPMLQEIKKNLRAKRYAG